MTTEREEYFKAYEEYSKVLRTWFVAYGIGGPVLLLTNQTLAKAIKASGQGKSLAALFLAGVALQVVLAALNKFSMWGSTSANSRRPSNPRVATGFVTGSAISSGLISRSMSRR